MPRKPDHVLKEPTDKACNGWRSKQKAYCTKSPGWATWHPGVGRCKLHGGANPDYAAEVYRLRALQEVRRYSLPVKIDPHTALLNELERTVGVVQFLDFKINTLEHEGPDANMVGPVGGAQGGFPEYKPNVYWGMWQSERKHLEDVAKACIAAGIEERRVQIAERQGEAIAAVLKAVIGELNIPDSEADKVPALVGKHLRLIQGGAEGAAQSEAA